VGRGELIVGFARLDGVPVGILASNPKHLGGVLFVDFGRQGPRASSGSATRFKRPASCSSPTFPAS